MLAVKRLKTAQSQEAFMYLKHTAPTHQSFQYSGSLLHCIRWEWTVHGYDFWKEIYQQTAENGYAHDDTP